MQSQQFKLDQGESLKNKNYINRIENFHFDNVTSPESKFIAGKRSHIKYGTVILNDSNSI